MKSLHAPDIFRKRLWQSAVAIVSIYLSFLLVAALQRDPAAGRTMGHDFVGLYVAGQFAARGEIASNYDSAAQLSAAEALVESEHLDFTVKYGAWLYPPFVNLALAPFTYLSYGNALTLWTLLGLTSVGLSCWLMIRMLPAESDWSVRGLVPLLIVASMPFVLTLGHGQNTFFSLLILSVVVTLWRASRTGDKRDWRQLGAREFPNAQCLPSSSFTRLAPYLTGAAAGLLFYKPQLAAVVTLALLLNLGWRAAVGLSVTGLFLLLTTLLFCPDALPVYARALTTQVEAMQSSGQFPWARHVTPLAFLHRLIGPVDAAPLGITRWIGHAISLTVIGLLLRLAWKSRLQQPLRDGLIVLTLLATPLIVPYFVDYDLLLLSVAGVLSVGLSGGRWITRMWVTLYACSLIGTVVAGQTPVTLTLPAVAILAGLHFRSHFRNFSIQGSPVHTVGAETLHALPKAA